MAKISARGDTVRWRFRNESSQELVYTTRGRLLFKAMKGGGYIVLAPNAGEDYVFDQADHYGMERVR